MENRNQGAVTAILLAAGQSRRWGAATPKVLQPLAGGACALQRMLQVVQACPSVQHWVCVAQPEVALKLSTLPEARHGTSVMGGATRAASVLKGLQCVQTPWTLIHDVARPLLTLAMLEQLLAYRGDLAMQGISFGTPLRDSLKVVASTSEAFRSLHAPPQASLWLTHTPQLFPTALLQKLASPTESPEKVDWRDEVEWALACGYAPRMVASPEMNWKLTYPEDKRWVETLLTAREKKL